MMALFEYCFLCLCGCIEYVTILTACLQSRFWWIGLVSLIAPMVAMTLFYELVTEIRWHISDVRKQCATSSLACAIWRALQMTMLVAVGGLVLIPYWIFSWFCRRIGIGSF